MHKIDRTSKELNPKMDEINQILLTSNGGGKKTDNEDPYKPLPALCNNDDKEMVRIVDRADDTITVFHDNTLERVDWEVVVACFVQQILDGKPDTKPRVFLKRVHQSMKRLGRVKKEH